jgi:uncharacterized membrane-anchored protein YhcB (DUF1043 family)
MATKGSFGLHRTKSKSEVQRQNQELKSRVARLQAELEAKDKKIAEQEEAYEFLAEEYKPLFEFVEESRNELPPEIVEALEEEDENGKPRKAMAGLLKVLVVVGRMHAKKEDN